MVGKIGSEVYNVLPDKVEKVVEQEAKEILALRPETPAQFRHLLWKYGRLYEWYREATELMEHDHAFDPKNETYTALVRQIEEGIAGPCADQFSKIEYHLIRCAKRVGMKKLSEDYREIIKKLQRDKELESPRNDLLEEQELAVLKRVEGITSIKDVDVLERDIESTNRTVREKAWRTMHEDILEGKNEISRIYRDQAFRWQEMLKNVGYIQPIDMRRYFLRQIGLGWTLRDAKKNEDAIQKEVTPHIQILAQRHAARLGLRRLRPWDLDPMAPRFAQPDGTVLTVACANIEQYLDGVEQIASQLSPKYLKLFTEMRHEGLIHYDKDHDHSMATCGHLEGQRKTYTILHGEFHSNDFVPDGLHELFGHAMHYENAKNDDLIFRRMFASSSAVRETFAYAMELIPMEYWDVFYADPEQHREAMSLQLKRMLFLLSCNHAVTSKLERTVLADPSQITPKNIDKWFKEISLDFWPENSDWKGLERYRSTQWHALDGIISEPFSDTEFNVALLGGSQLYLKYLQNPEETLRAIDRGQRIGAKKPLPDVYKAMGIEYIRPSSPRYPEHIRRIASSIIELTEMTEGQIPRARRKKK